MAQAPEQPKLPIHASRLRSALHTVLATAGWVLFAYWWWLVAGRVSEQEIRFTASAIAIALGVILLLTTVWVLHNIRIFRIRGPRTHLRSVPEDFSHDTVGRNVQFPTVPQDCLSAPAVTVRIRNGVKVYVAAGGPATPAVVAGPR